MKPTTSRYQRDAYSQLMDEPDIGSGEKTPGEQETEEFIRQVPPLPDEEGSGAARRSEQEDSLDKDEADSGLDRLDPVPPKG